MGHQGTCRPSGPRTCCGAGFCPRGSWAGAGAAAGGGPVGAAAGSACGSRPPSGRCLRSGLASPGTMRGPRLECRWGSVRPGTPHPPRPLPGPPPAASLGCPSLRSPPTRTTLVRSYTSSSSSFSFFFFFSFSGARSRDISSGWRIPEGNWGLKGCQGPAL